MMAERSLSIGELYTEALTLPVTLQVVTGYHDESREWQCLETGSTIRLHFFRDETVITGRLERENQQIRIPMHCEELFEPLPPIPELDDMQYQTAGDVLAARPMPSTVRVSQSWDGGDEEKTIQENDQLEDFGTIDNDVLGPCFTAKRVIEAEGEVIRERVCIPYDTFGIFTTTASPRERYTAFDLVQREKPLPQRVRVHGCRSGRSRGAVPPCPVKVELMRIETQRIALCSDMESGRLFLLPESLQNVQLRVPQVMRRVASKDWSQPLYLWMDDECLPRIGPETFEHALKVSSMPKTQRPGVLQLGIPTVLIPSALSLMCSDAKDLPDYRTFAKTGKAKIETVSVPANLVRVGSKPKNNIMALHSSLRREANQIQTVMRNQKEDYYNIGRDDGNVYESVSIASSGYEVPIQKLEFYESVDQSRHSTAKMDALYSEPDLNKPAVPLKPHTAPKPHTPPKPPKPRSPTSQIQLEAEISKLQQKITSVKKENKVLQDEISQTGGKVDLLTAQIRTLDTDLDHKTINEMDPNLLSQQLQSLDNIQVIQFLENLQLGEYMDKFLEAGVEGYLLDSCDRTYLQDVGMKTAHAVKLLAILKGRLPLGLQWDNLMPQ